MLFCAWKDVVEDNRENPEAGVPESIKKLKLPTYFKKEGDTRGFMAWNGFYLTDPDLHIAQLAHAYMEHIQSEASCGQCFPCRVGTKILAETLGRLCDGKGKAGDLEILRSVGEDIRQSSKCTVGKTAPVAMLKSLDVMADAWRDLVDNPRVLEKLDNVASHVTAPCVSACPAHQDVPTYVEHLRNGRYSDALEVIRDRNMLPGTCGRVCVRPCQSNCRRALVDDPILIKRLKRFVSDWELNHQIDPPDVPVELTRGPVAIIGAGPAGVACALNLLAMGVKCHVIDMLPRPGGMAAVGIPDYRLPPPLLLREINRIETLGGTFQFDTRVGKDVTIPQLMEQGYKAIFIGVGAHESRVMRIPGEKEGYQGFIHGIHFLRAVALGQPTVTGKKMVVVGGGNVAIDCVRTALRVGFTDVNLVYRRSRQEMPADDLEVTDAEQEGIKFHFLTTPTRVVADKSGKVTGIEMIKMELGEPDASGRRRPVPVEGSEYIMEADCVIPAIGQSPNMDLVPTDLGLEITKWYTIDGDPITGQSNIPNIFTGGDCLTGPDSLIAAVAAGHRSALAIDKFLDGKPTDPDVKTLFETHLHKMGIFDKDEKVPLPKGYEKAHYGHLPSEERIHNFEEVEMCFTAKDSIAEANRCLRCYRLALMALK